MTRATNGAVTITAATKMIAALLTISEMAEILRESTKTIRRKVDAGKYECIRLGKGPRAPMRFTQAQARKLTGGREQAFLRQ